MLIIAISLALGLGVAQVPQILEHLPELFKNIFSSGVATGGIAALILNIVLPETKIVFNHRNCPVSPLGFVFDERSNGST